MANKQILPNELKTDGLTLSEPKPMGNHGGKMINLSYNGRPLAMETPDMSVPYGISRFDDPAGDSGPKFSINLSFGDYQNNPKNKALFDAINSVDAFLIEKACENCQTWFRQRSMNTEVASALYSNPIQYPKDKETGEITTQYPPTFKCKLPYYDGKFTFKACDSNMVSINLGSEEIEDVIPRRSGVRAILRCRGIWVAAGKFGPMWSIDQLMITKAENMQNIWPFIDSDIVTKDSSTEENEDYQCA